MVRAIFVALYLLALAVCGGCTSEGAEWERTNATATPVAYETFLAKYPESPHASEARETVRRAADDARWREAVDSDSVESYSAYVAEWPDGAHSAEAATRVATLQEKADWSAAVAADTANSYAAYLDKYPASAHSTDARSRVEAKRKESEWPVAPLIEGGWQEVTDKQRARQLLDDLTQYVASEQLDAARRVTRFRERPLLCYAGSTLVEGLIPGSGAEPAGVIAFIRVADRGVTVLDGKSDPIHKLNREVGPRLSTTASAGEYLRLFCAAIRTERGGSFRLLETEASVLWAADAGEGPRSAASRLIRPLTIANVDGAWKATATVQHERSIFNAIFYLTSGGEVRMADDMKLLDNQPLRRDGMRGFVRYEIGLYQ